MAQVLAADGYDLQVIVLDSAVTLTVRARADACVECLVPRDLIADMARARLVKVDPSMETTELKIVYPTDQP